MRRQFTSLRNQFEFTSRRHHILGERHNLTVMGSQSKGQRNGVCEGKLCRLVKKLRQDVNEASNEIELRERKGDEKTRFIHSLREIVANTGLAI